MNNHKKIERFLEKIRVILKNINLKHAGTAVCVLAGVILVWLFAGMVASGSQPEETGEEALPAGVRLPGTEQASETEYAEDNRTQVLDYYNRIGVVYNVNGYLNIREKPGKIRESSGKRWSFPDLKLQMIPGRGGMESLWEKEKPDMSRQNLWLPGRRGRSWLWSMPCIQPISGTRTSRF